MINNDIQERGLTYMHKSLLIIGMVFSASSFSAFREDLERYQEINPVCHEKTRAEINSLLVENSNPVKTTNGLALLRKMEAIDYVPATQLLSKINQEYFTRKNIKEDILFYHENINCSLFPFHNALDALIEWSDKQSVEDQKRVAAVVKKYANPNERLPSNFVDLILRTVLLDRLAKEKMIKFSKEDVAKLRSRYTKKQKSFQSRYQEIISENKKLEDLDEASLSALLKLNQEELEKVKKDSLKLELFTND